MPAGVCDDSDPVRAATLAIEAMGARGALELLLTGVRGSLVAQLRPHVQVDDARLSRAVDAVLMPSILEAVPAMIAATAVIYARHFQVAELQQIASFFATPEPRDRIAFDASPVGQKLTALASTLNAEGHAANSAAMKLAIDDALRRHGADVLARALER